MEYSSPSLPTALSSTALADTAEIESTSLNTQASAEPAVIALESESPACSPASSSSSGRSTFQIFLSTFLTIFLAELGDKTQVTTLLMSAESHAPWIVFAGAGTALVATSLIGVWLGCWLAKRVAPDTLEKAAGCLLLLISAQLFWELLHG